jgi:hypothetical protein
MEEKGGKSEKESRVSERRKEYGGRMSLEVEMNSLTL